jgi:subtilisin family serine protease
MVWRGAYACFSLAWEVTVLSKTILLAVVLASTAACSTSPTGESSDLSSSPVVSSADNVAISGRFIVTLQDGVIPAAVAREHGVQPDYVYTHALTGFAGAISEAARAGLLRDARVRRVEPDGIATIVSTESNATWGLDRVDQHALPLSTTYSYSNTGSGVTAYIIDTGILFSHSEFSGGRAISGFDAVDGGSADDCNGHGTHVAGIVGGSKYGIAKGVKLVAVRVLNCSALGTWSGVIAGLDWVTAQRAKPAVANMSLGGGASSSADEAVGRMIASGVATAVAAGNGNNGGVGQNACNYSPARVPAAMTIGATDKGDRKAPWSNYGDCIDWFAPGVGITSAWYTSSTATNTISGTSMAAPHTTGVAALYLQSHISASPSTVRNALYANLTKGIVTLSRTANNHLLYTDY